MRIAINAWFLDRPTTGSGQYLAGLLRSFAQVASGNEILLVAPGLDASYRVPGLDVHVWPVRGAAWRTDLGKVFFEQVLFPRACRRWAAGVAHVPYWGSPLLPAVPTVVTIHDLIPLLLEAYRGGPLVRFYTGLVSLSARRAAAVLADSDASAADVHAHLHLRDERVHRIYLAAGDRFSPHPEPGDEAIRDGYRLPRRYALYLAGHDVRKNVAGLIHAFSTVAGADDDVTLVVGGRLPQPPGPRSWLRGPSPLFDPRPLVAALGLQDRVQFTGVVDEAAKPALYRGAACAVFPSRYEGFGLPVLEALACGTPLVTSDRSSLPELVGDAGFAVDPDDVAGLAGAILACLVDPALAAELRRRGPLQAARFSWELAAQQTLAVYEDVSATHAVRTPARGA
jgi:glycosyltransferase involved in cell wall biosynthesis